MNNSRRSFLRGSAVAVAAGTAAASLPSCDAQSPDRYTPERVTTPEIPLEDPFKHGVASGDPTESSAIIWTRVTHLNDSGEFVPGDVLVEWNVYSDPQLTILVASGTEMALEAHDYCVKLDITGLEAYKAYYYQFRALAYDSPIGRFQTLPDWDADVTDKRLRIAVVSCSNYPHGYFHVYNEIAQRNDIDLVIHLGDYLYEYGNGEYGDTRDVDPPHEMISLDDYRRRHATYKTDPDLAELHRQYAFINIWDDHETTDNSRKCTANNHTEADSDGLNPDDPGFNEGYWYQRKTFGIRAFFEWMPIRPVEDDRVAANDLYTVSVGKTWRSFKAGKFLDIIMLDTRKWGRDDQASGAAFQKDNVRNYQSADPNCGDTTAHRDMLGPDQEIWLHNELQSSAAKWKLIGNQLIMSHLRTTPAVKEDLTGIELAPATYLNTDAWDGYPTSQERLYSAIKGDEYVTAYDPGTDTVTTQAGSAVDNVVVITGDIHTSWAFDVTPDPDALPNYEAIAVEFVGPSVSSPGLPIPSETANAISAGNLHLKYTNLEQRGWVLVDLNPDHCTGEWYHIGTDAAVDSDVRPAPSTLARAYRTSSAPGDNGLELNSDVTGAAIQTQPSENYLANRPAMAPTKNS